MSDAGPPPTIRLDKWLWHVRAVKTRALAAKLVRAGVRVNGQRVTKPAAQVGPGDTLTFAQGDRVRVLRLRAVGTRRGPAPEARALYDDLSPPPPARDPGAPVRGPRPDKRDRRRFAAPDRGALD